MTIRLKAGRATKLRQTRQYAAGAAVAAFVCKLQVTAGVCAIATNVEERQWLQCVTLARRRLSVHGAPLWRLRHALCRKSSAFQILLVQLRRLQPYPPPLRAQPTWKPSARARLQRLRLRQRNKNYTCHVPTCSMTTRHTLFINQAEVELISKSVDQVIGWIGNATETLRWTSVKQNPLGVCLFIEHQCTTASNETEVVAPALQPNDVVGVVVLVVDATHKTVDVCTILHRDRNYKELYDKFKAEIGADFALKPSKSVQLRAGL